LTELRPHVPAAYATGCDVPLLRPEFIRAVIASLGSHEIAIPREREFHHPLAAVYRTCLAERVDSLIAARRLRPLFLVQESDARQISVDDLRLADPHLDSLRNTNSPAEYSAALATAGFP
jgi:molybdopterin-guanine dinucleotide biosynthesis protein A